MVSIFGSTAPRDPNGLAVFRAQFSAGRWHHPRVRGGPRGAARRKPWPQPAAGLLRECPGHDGRGPGPCPLRAPRAAAEGGHAGPAGGAGYYRGAGLAAAPRALRGHGRGHHDGLPPRLPAHQPGVLGHVGGGVYRAAGPALVQRCQFRQRAGQGLGRRHCRVYAHKQRPGAVAAHGGRGLRAGAACSAGYFPSAAVGRPGRTAPGCATPSQPAALVARRAGKQSAGAHHGPQHHGHCHGGGRGGVPVFCQCQVPAAGTNHPVGIRRRGAGIHVFAGHAPEAGPYPPRTRPPGRAVDSGGVAARCPGRGAAVRGAAGCGRGPGRPRDLLRRLVSGA